MVGGRRDDDLDHRCLLFSNEIALLDGHVSTYLL